MTDLQSSLSSVQQFALAAIFAAVMTVHFAESASAQQLRNCLSGASADQVASCDEEASRLANARSQTTALGNGWRLVKTLDSNSKSEIVSVMQIADIAKSDIGLAGLSLRCGQNGMQVIVILLEALPRATRTLVVLNTPTNRTEFEASVTQGGEALLLPQPASMLANGEWQNAAELSIDISARPNPIHGVVPIQGLAAALRALPPNCLNK